jgi:hypothetical protein
MTTATQESPTISNSTDKVKLPLTMVTLQALRTARGTSDDEIHGLLDAALEETSKAEVTYVLERIMLHIGDVSRQHNMLKEIGIKSDKGGAQERVVFRSILRWWEKALPESFKRNIKVFAEYTLLENLMFYQLTTDRYNGNLQNVEILFPMPAAVHAYLASEIRANKNVNLIARHLPKFETGKSRTTKKIVNVKYDKESYVFKLPQDKAWVKVNGVVIDGESVTVKTGDVITYPRAKQSETLTKQTFINKWITDFCEVLGWSISDYKQFRKKQNTPEQKFSSGSVANMPKSDFMTLLDSLTGGQRYRVSRMLKNVAKYPELSSYYLEWETNQGEVANKIREAADSGDEETLAKLKKEFKVKGTGINTIDLLEDLFSGKFTDLEINNTYQAMIENMDLIANVFPIIDGSGSMDCTAGSNGWDSTGKVTNRDVAYAMAIAFSTRNPIDAFKNTFGWFSRNFHIVGHSKYRDTRPNRYVSNSEFVEKTDAYQVLSATNTFTENLNNLRENDPGEISSTNMGAAINYFVELVEDGKFHVEDLPNALLFITDNEDNDGMGPGEALAQANKIGWNPLAIFWGVTQLSSRMTAKFRGIPNCLLVSGFNESVLSQILRGIKTGSVNPEDEIWSIAEDKRYSVIKR